MLHDNGRKLWENHIRAIVEDAAAELKQLWFAPSMGEMMTITRGDLTIDMSIVPGMNADDVRDEIRRQHKERNKIRESIQSPGFKIN